MIREIVRSEIPECAALIRESFLTVANEFNFTQTNAPGFTAFSTNNDRLYWQYDNENRKMFAFLSESTIVGYYSLLFDENNECELSNLCVNPAYRHRKIGEQLLNHCYDHSFPLRCKAPKRMKQSASNAASRNLLE